MDTGESEDEYHISNASLSSFEPSNSGNYDFFFILLRYYDLPFFQILASRLLFGIAGSEEYAGSEEEVEDIIQADTHSWQKKSTK